MGEKLPKLEIFRSVVAEAPVSLKAAIADPATEVAMLKFRKEECEIEKKREAMKLARDESRRG